MSSEPPAQKVSDEDLIRAVRDECLLSPEPMVKTEDIADREDITIRQNSVATRLGNLAEDGRLHSINVGTGYVWSVADEDDIEGEVKYEHINWDNIPIEEIPSEKLEEHPDVQSYDTWKSINEKSQTILGLSLIFLFVGFASLILANINIPQDFSSVLSDVGVITVVSGGVVSVAGIIGSVAASVGTILEQRGLIDAGRELWLRSKARIRDGIPLSVEISWDR